MRRLLRTLAAAGVCAAAPFVGSCSHDASTVVIPQDDPGATLSDWTMPTLADEPVMITPPTYEASGQAVHPDVAFFPDGWNGSRYWMAMTPYPFGSSMYENPSLLVSDDGLTVRVPAGITNPLIKPPQYPDYNSDPDLIYDAAHTQLVLSYRVVAGGKNSIYTVTSSDGTHWSSPRLAFAEPNHSAVSQTMVPAYHAVPPLAWYVDAGPSGCSANFTRVMLRRAQSVTTSFGHAKWSAPVATDMSVPGYLIWHLKIRYVPSKHEYWALVVAYPNDGRGCGSDDLFLSHSTDGEHWVTLPQPLMHHEDRDWTAGALYRGTFLYSPEKDALAIWFSARSSAGDWRLGFVTMNYTALVARLSATPARRRIVPGAGGAAPLRPIWTTAP